MKNLYISYCQHDRHWADWIAWQLESAGYSVVLGATDSSAGISFLSELRTAASNSERVMLLISSEYLNTLQTQPGIIAGMLKGPLSTWGGVVPIRVQECDLESLLPGVMYIDLVGLDEADARDAVLTAVQRGRSNLHTPPSFPGTGENWRPFPTPLPAVWNVPFLRNRHFVGFETEMVELKLALHAGNPPILVVAGGGGTGKTALAIEYAYRNASAYSQVWWVGAGDSDSLKSDYLSFARGLGLIDERTTDVVLAAKTVGQWMESNSDWLMIFDDAPSAHVLRPYLPRRAAGHIIVTSRNSDWGDFAQIMQPKPLPTSDAVRFLLTRTKQPDRTAATALARLLQGLPLALEQAAACVQAAGLTFHHYLRLFREQQSGTTDPVTAEKEYPDAVHSALRVTLLQVHTVSSTAAALLNLLSVLAPQPVPLDILKDGAVVLPPPLRGVKGKASWSDVSTVLHEYGLASVTSTVLTIHPLVQSVVRLGMDSKTQKRWAQAAVRLVSRTFPLDGEDVSTWADCSRLLPHAFAAVDYAESHGVARKISARLLSQVALYLYARAAYGEAKSALERALLISHELYGEHSPATADVLTSLGTVLGRLGSFSEAQRCLQDALTISIKELGPDHPNVAVSLNNLATLLHNLGDFQLARDYLGRAIEIDAKAFGPTDWRVATRYQNIGSVQQAMGDLDAAQESYQKALEIWQQRHGDSHPRVANVLSDLGSLLFKEGNYPAAEEMVLRALHVNELMLGPDHPDVGLDWMNLSAVLTRRGQLSRAKTAGERALSILEAAYGREHVAVASCLMILAAIHDQTGDDRNPRLLLERAYAIRLAAYGPENPATLQVVRRLRALSVSIDGNNSQSQSTEGGHDTARVTGGAV